ncbi:MAG: hypothetical protein MUC84_05010 [Solirubrobacteraceae bacterium]|jgi:hypothetical protein|nr:hypothetical protein [Solirubrobacteraceae bacterium]MCU0313405.1 hypothetical protein [Solirubrobacteraceae bacterium]
MSVTPVPPPGVPEGLACPRCGEHLAAEQDWCLRCGDPARTVIAPTPRWRRPLAALAALGVVALGVLTAAFIGLSDDDPPPPKTLTTTTTLAPGAAPAPGQKTVVPPTTTTTTTTTVTGGAPPVTTVPPTTTAPATTPPATTE